MNLLSWLPLLVVVAGGMVTWLHTTHSKCEDRRRDAWAGWAEQAYRALVTRRELIERCWAARSTTDKGGRLLAQSIEVGLRREIAGDATLHSALARVLLTEPSSTRRKQARAFTDLLSGDIDDPGVGERAVLRSHDQYLAALQATLDELLGTYAEKGTTAQVRTWFKDRYRALLSKDEPIQIVHVEDEPRALPPDAAR